MNVCPVPAFASDTPKLRQATARSSSSKRPIENNSSAGQAVYEPFSGSGTTIIAAEMTGRSCHAVELNPTYVDVAILRWRAFTGEQAVLEGDGRSFAQIEAQRQPAAAATAAKDPR